MHTFSKSHKLLSYSLSELFSPAKQLLFGQQQGHRILLEPLPLPNSINAAQQWQNAWTQLSAPSKLNEEINLMQMQPDQMVMINDNEELAYSSKS